MTANLSQSTGLANLVGRARVELRAVEVGVGSHKSEVWIHKVKSKSKSKQGQELRVRSVGRIQIQSQNPVINQKLGQKPIVLEPDQD